MEEQLNFNEMAVVKARGSLDQLTTMDIVKELARLHKSGKALVAVDMSEVSFMNSSAMGMFIYACKTVSKQSMVILNPSSVAKQLLTDTNLHRVFRIVYREPKKD